MPTERPTADDLELSRCLAGRGLNRKPRTCLGWRRDLKGGWQPSYDEDDQPHYSEASITLWEMYGRTVHLLGHARAVAHMWGCGVDFPSAIILPALRTWQIERDRAGNELANRIEADPGGYGHETYRDIRRSSPAIADEIRTEARRLQPPPVVEVGSGQWSANFRAPWPELRSVIIGGALDAHLEGGEVAVEAFEEYTAERGAPDDLVMIAAHLRAEGGPAPIAEVLSMLDACEAFEDNFTRLLVLRNEYRRVVDDDEQFGELAATVPSVGSLLSVLRDPLLGPAWIVTTVLQDAAIEYRATVTATELQDQLHRPAVEHR